MHYLGLLELVVPHTSQHTRDLPNHLSYDCNLWNHLVFRLLLPLFLLAGLSKRTIEPSRYFHRISFLFLSCSHVQYVHGMCYWISRSTTGIIINVAEYSLKLVVELVASTSHGKFADRSSPMTLMRYWRRANQSTSNKLTTQVIMYEATEFDFQASHRTW